MGYENKFAGAILGGTLQGKLTDGYAEGHALLLATIDKSITKLPAVALAGVTEVGGYAFYNCAKLTSVALPGTVRILKGAAFQNCTALTSVKLPEGVIGIYASAFQGCTKLTEMTIPESVIDLSGHALRIGSSTNKATITFLRTTPPPISSTTFDATFLQKIIVPAGCGDAYKAATNWAAFADYIEEATA